MSITMDNIEKEIDDYLETFFNLEEEKQLLPLMKIMALYFYKRGIISKRKARSITLYDEDIDDKAKEIATKWKAHGVPYNAIHEAVIEMAKYQKEKMMNYGNTTLSVEAKVINDWTYGKDPDHKVIPAIHYRLPDTFMVWDKVELIIIKKE